MYIYRLRKKNQNFPQTAEQPPGVQESRLSRAPSLSAVAQAWIHIGIKLKIFSHFLYIWKKNQPSCWKDALFKGLPDGCKASHRQTTSFTRLCHESPKIFTFIPMCNFSLLALGNPACHARYLSLSLSLSLSLFLSGYLLVRFVLVLFYDSCNLLCFLRFIVVLVKYCCYCDSCDFCYFFVKQKCQK